MNLQQLEYIVAVDHHRSFSKAADACFVTQATLSIMIKKLEVELDLILFDRKTQPILTTECGREIIAEAKKTLFYAQRVKERASLARGRIEGELRLGIIPTVAGNLLHRILPVSMSRYPDLHLTIQELTTPNILEKLKSGELDGGIVSTPLKQAPEIESELLYYESLWVYGSAQPNTMTFLSPKDLADETIWLLEKGNCLTEQIQDVCSLKAKPMRSNLVFQPNSFDSLLNIVDHLTGLTLVPELFVQDMASERKSRVRQFISPYPVREISLISYRPYVKARLVQAISQVIREVIPPQLQTYQWQDHDLMIAKM